MALLTHRASPLGWASQYVLWLTVPSNTRYHPTAPNMPHDNVTGFTAVTSDMKGLSEVSRRRVLQLQTQRIFNTTSGIRR